MEALLAALDAAVMPLNLAYMFAGVLVGIVFAAIPGLTIFMAIVLTLPFTFTMSPIQGLTTMLGVYVGGLSGGLIASILLGIPGNPASIPTLFDGHPMARKGEPGRALAIGIMASFFGGLIGVAILIFLAPPILILGLMFGPWEIFALVAFALSILASLGGGSVAKSLMAGMFGLFIATIGIDPIQGSMRLTFGLEGLSGGVNLLPAVIGLYAFSSLVTGVEESVRPGAATLAAHVVRREWMRRPPYLQAAREVLGQPVNLIRSAVIGCLVGALPGAGSSTGSFLAYDQAKKLSRNPAEFGTGSPRGIVASEAGNSSVAPGALVMTLGLGIPGDPGGALMLGALMIHGINPGPLLYQEQPVLVSAVFIALVLAHPAMLLCHFIGLRWFIRASFTPKHYLFPIVFVFCIVGAYTANYQLFDLWVFLAFGLIGYAFTRWQIPLEPVALALILGPMAEINLRRALMTNPDPMLFLTRPISATLLAIAAVSLVVSIWQAKRIRPTNPELGVGRAGGRP